MLGSNRLSRKNDRKGGVISVLQRNRNLREINESGLGRDYTGEIHFYSSEWNGLSLLSDSERLGWKHVIQNRPVLQDLH